MSDLVLEHPLRDEDHLMEFEKIDDGVLVSSEGSDVPDDIRHVDVGPKEIHVCQQCSRSFMRKGDLNRHVKIHDGVKKYVCATCMRSFFRKENLDRHITIHKKLKKINNCHQCSETFMRKEELRLHVKTHKLVKQYACPTCCNSFSKKMELIQHMYVHKKPAKLYDCHICLKTFARKVELRCHMKTHIPEKSYICSVCSESFSRESELMSHLLTHKQSRTFTCKKCDAIFKQRLELKEHMSIHMKCDQCDKSFSTITTLKHHQRVSHRPVKYILPKQEKSFDVAKQEYSDSTPHVGHMQLSGVKTALGVFSTYTLIPSQESRYDLILLFNDMRADVGQLLEKELEIKKGIKWYVLVKVQLRRIASDGEEEVISPFFRSKCHIELRNHTISDHIEEGISKITTSFEEFIQRGSGWILNHIENVELDCAQYHPFATNSKCSRTK